MKPRTKLQRELQEAIDNGRLTPLNAKQMEQAHKIWERKENRRYKLMLYTTQQRINGATITKCYKAHKIGKGNLFTFYQLCIVRAERNGETAWASRHTNIGVLDSFSHIGELTIKLGRWWFADYVNGSYPLQTRGKANPYLVVRHQDNNTYEFRDNRVETLMKIGREDFVDLMIRRERGLTDKMYAALKIAQRHHYDFNGDLYMWVNMVEMLIFGGMDYRNPKYICPVDFAQTRHQVIDVYDKKLVQIQRKKDENAAIRLEAQRLLDEEYRRRREEERRKREKEEEMLAKTYEKRLAKWLGMVITNGSIIIKPLQNIEEFKEEGKAMHHCVYQCGYYKKKDILILSAKDTNGKRLATIEFNLNRNEIVQCRAACNEHPKDYDTICDLVMGAMVQQQQTKAA